MAEAFMAYPELRNPFEKTPIHEDGSTTVLYQGRTIVLDQTGPGDDLLVRAEDLPGVNGFVVKPEGACFEELCVPLNENLLVEADGVQWLNLSAFAEHMGQAYVADAASRVWSFAEMPVKRDNMMMGAMVPDVEVTDRSGNVIRPL